MFDRLEPRLLLSGDMLSDAAAPAFPASGEWAIEAVGADLDSVAGRYDLAGEALAEMFRADSTLHVDAAGQLYYADPLPPVSIPPPVERDSSGASSDADSDAPFPLAETFTLHSRPGATKIIYLDFDGHLTPAGTAWNDGKEIDSAPFDRDGDGETFSPSEQESIQRIWQRVVEDYAPFDVDVTTEDPGQAALTRSTWRDRRYGIRCVISPTSDWYPDAGGVAYLRVFDTMGTGTKPAFVFSDRLSTDKYVADAAAHEVGHTLGLDHDGLNDGTEYYPGHGSGTTGWSTIMGLGYYKNVVQWSKGEYFGANNTQDDLNIIATQNGFGYRPDDHGNSRAGATTLVITGQSGVIDQGVIERTDDVDMFSFVADGGTVSLNVDPFTDAPNLDVLAVLYDSVGAVVATSDPANDLSAEITVSLGPGTYYLSVAGTGIGDPLNDPPRGYTEYGSVGQYWISGMDGNEPPTDITLSAEAVAENSPGGTVVGTVSGDDPESDVLTFTLTGDAGGRFVLVDNVLSVADGATLDHEKAPSHHVTIEADDGELTYSEILTITVTDVNEAPTDLTLGTNVAVDSAPDLTPVGTLVGTDPDDDDLILSLTDDAGGRFALAGDSLVIADSSLLDHQAEPTHSVTVEATDGEFTFTRTFTIYVLAESVAPGAPDLLALTDSGLRDDDNLTNRNNATVDSIMLFAVNGTLAGSTITIHADGQVIGSAHASGPTTVVVTDQTYALDDGDYVITARQRESGKGRSPDSPGLALTVDTAAPTVTTLGMQSSDAAWAHGTINAGLWMAGRPSMTAPWSTLDQLVIVFGETVTAASPGDLTLRGAVGGVLTSRAVTGLGGEELTWTVTPAGQYLGPDSYTVSLGTGVTDTAGNASDGTWNFGLNVLPGDVYSDGRVSIRDRRALRDAFGSATGQPTYSLFADLNGDGRVSSRDRAILRESYGSSLPAPAPLAAPTPPPSPEWPISMATTGCRGLCRPERTAQPRLARDQVIPSSGGDDTAHGTRIDTSIATTPPPAVSPAGGTSTDRPTPTPGAPSPAQLEPDLSTGLVDPLAE